MAIQLSTAVRNARLDAIESTIGTSAKIRIFSGSAPANPAAANTGTLLASYDLASDWAAAAGSGAKALNGLPLSTTAVASGAAGYFRIFNSAADTCGLQGTVANTGGGADLEVDNSTINSGQTVNITGFTLTDANA